MSKQEWPELVGKPGEEAKAIIQSERPDLNEVTVLPEGSVVTADYRTDRVRMFVNYEGNVVTTPKVG